MVGWPGPSVAASPIVTSRSGSAYGSGSKRTALTTLKAAVLTPTPNAIVSIAVAVKPGLRASVRNPNRTSWRNISRLLREFLPDPTILNSLYYTALRGENRSRLQARLELLQWTA